MNRKILQDDINNRINRQLFRVTSIRYLKTWKKNMDLMNKEIDDKYQKRENTTFKNNQTEI